MGMYWGAKLFFGCVWDTNPLYGNYDPETYEYEFEEAFEEIQDLIAYRDEIEIPSPWDLVDTENKSYEEYSKEPDYIAASAERDYIYGQLNARIPIFVEHGYDYDSETICYVKNYYYSTYQTEVLDIPLLNNPPPELYKDCVNFCAHYGLPEFKNAGWKLHGEIEH